jgi:secreted PhoX family phosphatase
MPLKDDDCVSNESTNETFRDVVEARLSRRGFMTGSLATAAAASLGGVGRCSALSRRPHSPTRGYLDSRVSPSRPPTR